MLFFLLLCDDGWVVGEWDGYLLLCCLLSDVVVYFLLE